MDNNETNRPVCNCCGATIETDDYYTFNGSILCDDCYHIETVTCEHCGDRIWADDNAGSDSMPLCNSCYDDYYTTCECCGRIIHRDYANYDDDDDYAYCDRCYEERQNSSIHEYNYKPDPIFYGDSNPLALYHYETCGLYVYASTESILDCALTRLGILSIEHQKINTSCGDILKINSTGAMERGMFDTTNLMMYDYRYFRRDWWSVPESCESEPQDVKQLKDFASSIGVSREDIDLLLSYGYFVEEIEEMLYQPGVIEEALCEILNECAYDYCGEF